MPNEFSPEERLLRLIRGKQQAPASGEAAPAKTAEEKTAAKEGDRKGMPLATGKAPLPKEPLAREKLPTLKEGRVISGERLEAETKPNVYRRQLPLWYKAYAYIITGICLLAMAAIFIFLNKFSLRDKEGVANMQRMIASLSEGAKEDVAKPKEDIVKTKEQSRPPEQPPEEPAQAKAGPSFDDYQKVIRSKSLFAPPTRDRGGSAVSTESNLRDMVKDLRLVGIMPGDEPQAIIEDKKNGQTLFLKKGERIGEAEIKEILDGRVILGYGNETITLSM